MALDVSDVLVDPDLATHFDVLRRTTGTDSHGRATMKPETKEGIVGVVCAASSNDLERLDDSQLMGRHLSIVTRFRLQGPAPGFQPDIVLWNGDAFVVQHIDPYPQYGTGFVQAIVGSVDSIDAQLPFVAKADTTFGGQSGDGDGDE